jgi:ABC-type lipoprotein release transport system permease subunit
MMEPRFYSDFGPWMIGHVLLVSLCSAVIASLYPAWFAARTDPASALRVAQ